MKLNDSVYLILKWACLIALPAASTLYFTLATIWGLPYADQVPGTLSAIGLFLGALIGISTVTYNKTEGNK